jgi:ribonuclease HII
MKRSRDRSADRLSLYGTTSRPGPTLDQEGALWRQGFRLVAGVDEVGRGPLAGPVVAGAVILPPRRPFSWLEHVRDSKELPAQRREELATCIWCDALAVGLGSVAPAGIDEVGIVPATRRAMLEALAGLTAAPHYIIVDALPLPELSLPHKPIVNGDALSISIACASIVAKVARDGLMAREDRRYPGYGFARNKGYGTPEHLAALRCRGPCDIHRRTFAPVRDALADHSDPLSRSSNSVISFVSDTALTHSGL